MPVPTELEILSLKITDNNGKGLLYVGCYRPPLQGTALIDYLTVNLDAMMVANQCEYVIIIGDINQNTVREAFNTLLVVHNLHNHVTFPTHSSGSSLDPVVTNLPPNTTRCSSLGFVRTLWRWEKANWQALRAFLRGTNWVDVLCGDTEGRPCCEQTVVEPC